LQKNTCGECDNPCRKQTVPTTAGRRRPYLRPEAARPALPASSSRMFKRFSLLFLSLIFSAAAAVAQQSGAVKGFVYEGDGSEPAIFVNVVLAGERNYAVQTDLNGYFSIPQVAPGIYLLRSYQPGSDTAEVEVTIGPDAVVTQKLFLKDAPRNADRVISGVEVTAGRTERQTQVRAGALTITPRDMKLLPSAGGEPDIAQFLQVTPGVVFTGDQGGQLYIRGGSPAQTGILLDGVTIYNPFHSIGLYSVFETDAIRSADVLTAGFNAEYGNRTSAILDIRTKDGNRNRLSGKLSASPIMGRAMLEGPLVKPRTPGGGSTTFLIAAKHSWLDQTSKSLYGGLGEPYETGLPFSFTDLYGKITLSGANGSKLNLFGFNFDDRARIINPNTDVQTADFRWRATGGAATFVVTPGSSSALITGKFAYSRYNIDYNEVNFRPRTSGINGFEGAINFAYFLPRYSLLQYGIEVSGLQTTLDYLNVAGLTTELNRRTTMAAGYLLFRKNFSEKLIIEPSFRVQYYTAINRVSPEPRVGVKYNISRNVRLKAAGGFYSQILFSTRSDRDIVNFFTGFLLAPDQTIRDENGATVNNNLMTAYHALGGIEVDVNRVILNLEPWYKRFGRAIELNRTKRIPTDPDYQAGNGEAYGVDLSARYNVRRVYLWGTFSYQQVENTFQVADALGGTTTQTYPTPFDRRININLVGAYTFGSKRDLEVSARYNLGSPFPFTQTQGFYENLNLTAQGINTNYVQQNGSIGILYPQQINGGRLSYFHRLDLSARKRFEISRNTNFEVTAAVTNAYNRDNIFYVDRVSNERVFQLPIFPSLNATFNF